MEKRKLNEALTFPSLAHDKMIPNYIISRPFNFALRNSIHSAHKFWSRFYSYSPVCSSIYLIASYKRHS